METGILFFEPTVYGDKVIQNMLGIGEPINRQASPQRVFSAVKGDYIDNYNTNEIADQPEETNLILIIPVEGMITRRDVMNDKGDHIAYYGMTSVARMIQGAIQDKRIKAIILDTDSGGGFSNANSEVIEALKNFQADGRLAYAAVDIACSACYHFISFCKGGIYAKSKFSIMGSLGVKWDGYRYTKPSGVEEITVVSDLSPDKNKEWDEALKGKSELLKDHILNPMAKAMHEDIRSQRNIPEDIMLGSSLASELALQNGLCDGIMSIQELIQGIASGTIKPEAPKPKSKASDKAPAPAQTTAELPKQSVQSNQNNPMKKFNLFSFLGLPSEEKEAKVAEASIEIARLNGVEAEFEQFKTSSATEKKTLEEQITAIKAENETLKAEKARLEQITSNTPGASPTQPVATTDETQKVDVVEVISKSTYDEFDSLVRAKSSLNEGNYNFK